VPEGDFFWWREPAGSRQRGSAFQFAALCGSHYLIENRRGVTTLAASIKRE